MSAHRSPSIDVHWVRKMQNLLNTMMGFDSLKDVLDVALIPVALALLVPWRNSNILEDELYRIF
jgi:hypothetical protein